MSKVTSAISLLKISYENGVSYAQCDDSTADRIKRSEKTVLALEDAHRKESYAYELTRSAPRILE